MLSPGNHLCFHIVYASSNLSISHRQMLAKLDTSLKLFGALMLAIVACLAILPFVSSHQANATLDMLKEVASKERAYNIALSMLKDAETGQRGFLLGSDESFLEPYNAGVAGLPAALEELTQLASSSDERVLVGKIDRLARAKVLEMNKTIVLNRAGESQAAIDMVASQRGKLLMDQLRNLIRTQLNSLAQQRVELRAELTASLQYNTALGLGASMASFVIICGSIFVAAHSLNQRTEATKQAELLAETNAKHATSAGLRAAHVSATAQMLQAIDSIKAPDELSQVLPVFLSKLLPNTSGQVHLYRSSRDFLELKAHWGARNIDSNLLSPNDCWALRLGKIHHADAKGLCCAHANAEVPVETQMCFPMISQGDVIGLLTISGPFDGDEVPESDDIVTLAEQLGLSISNVLLRDTLRQQSTVDPLTGLYNRRHFDDTLRREMVRAQRTEASCSVVMVDLDHFKRVNDTYGHDAGDLVLKAASQKILGRVRASDVVCRYGGEELVLLLPDCTAEAAAKCAENIRQAFAEISIHHLYQHISGITASFGVASFPAHAETSDEILKAADRALYVAKNTGRNQVVIAELYGEKVVALSSRARSTSVQS